MQSGQVTIDPCGQRSLVPKELLMEPQNAERKLVLRIEDLVVLFDAIHLSWNPTIYDFVIHRESRLTK